VLYCFLRALLSEQSTVEASLFVKYNNILTQTDQYLWIKTPSPYSSEREKKNYLQSYRSLQYADDDERIKKKSVLLENCDYLQEQSDNFTKTHIASDFLRASEPNICVKSSFTEEPVDAFERECYKLFESSKSSDTNESNKVFSSLSIEMGKFIEDMYEIFSLKGVSDRLIENQNFMTSFSFKINFLDLNNVSHHIRKYPKRQKLLTEKRIFSSYRSLGRKRSDSTLDERRRFIEAGIVFIGKDDFRVPWRARRGRTDYKRVL